MNEPFTLEIIYQGKPLEFSAAFQRYGFSYRIAIMIDDVNYFFEPDEEGSYRVLGAAASAKPAPDPGLLAAIAEKIAKIISIRQFTRHATVGSGLPNDRSVIRTRDGKNKSPQTLAAGDFQPKPYHN